MKPSVSIVVPVYNAERYLEACLDSLTVQTLRACEFIFVNDGSTDRSRLLIERRMEADPRIKLLDQANRGVSAARNAGLRCASGEYVAFVDADDYVEADMYARLLQVAVANDCDVVLSHFENELEGCRSIVRYPFPLGQIMGREQIGQDVLPYFLESDNLNTVCNKLYRNQVIQDNGLGFPEGIKLGEDGIFNIRFFGKAESMIYLDYTGYHYREVAGSATRNVSRHDYFGRSLEAYMFEPPELYDGREDVAELRERKAVKLVDSVLSYIYLYFTPTVELRFSERYAVVRRMIHHPYVRDALPLYCNRRRGRLGRYERILTRLIERQSAWGLYCATAYCRMRTNLYRRNRH